MKTRMKAALAASLLALGLAGAAIAQDHRGDQRGPGREDDLMMDDENTDERGSGPMGYGRGKGGRGLFRQADTNNDGAISLDEALAMRAARFARHDPNGDGVITQAEVEAQIRERVERMAKRLVRRLDQDRDGQVSRTEFEQVAAERFRWNDLNDDGKLTPDELPRGRHGWHGGGHRGGWGGGWR